MWFRGLIIAVLLILNFVKEPSFWEVNGYILLGVLIMFATILPGVGWIVVVGCGYLMYNFLYNIHDWNIIMAIIGGILVAGLMGRLLTGPKPKDPYRNKF